MSAMVPPKNGLQLLRALADKRGVPSGVHLQVADRCNHTCQNCYQVQGEKGEMSIDEVKGVLDDLAAQGVLQLSVSGGEATLRPPVQFIRAPDPGLRRLRRDGRFDTIDSLGAASGGDDEIVSAIGLPTPRPEGSYGLVFEGFVDVPADGLYTFGMRSDDASRLRIGDDVVIDHGDGASWEWWQGRIGLRAGWHPIRIEYTQLDGDQRLQLRWSGPGFAAESVPTARLAH